ncbi:RNA-binding component of cleavage and polyadenylation factor [Tilletia horrida]|nr:RNA-binding component of cleavage and polyadenylation factor [Tilletia horrida]
MEVDARSPVAGPSKERSEERQADDTMEEGSAAATPPLLISNGNGPASEDEEEEARTPPNADLHHLTFPFESFIASTLRLKLDNPSSTICQTYLRTGGQCPRGARCPRRHVPPPPAALGQRDPQRRTVCKHWLRGLCKKGENCDYLHEYDLRRMPECRFYASFGFCPSGDECLYLHVDAKAKVRECEHFRRGFCPKAFAPPSQRTDRTAAGGGGGHVSFGGGGPPTRTWQGGGQGAGIMGGEDGPSRPPRRDYQGQHGGGGRQMGEGGGGGGGGGGGMRKDLSEVLCFKCGQTGHYANKCTNPHARGLRREHHQNRDRSQGGGGGGGGGGGWQ